MAGKTFVNASDLVLLPGVVITQEHNLRNCLSMCGIKLIDFQARCNWFWAFEDAICHYFHALIRNIQQTINLIGNLAVCYGPI